MVGQHNQLNTYAFELTLGDSEGQGSLARCSPWGHEDSNGTDLSNTHRRFYSKNT